MSRQRLLSAFYIGPLVLWMLIIFVMSTSVGRSDNSLGVIESILSRTSPAFLASLSVYQLDRMNYIVRKAGHLSEYAILTLLAVRALQSGRRYLRWRSFLGALALTALYAASDELHQQFVAGRTSTPMDVLIDMMGSVVCMGALLLWFGLKRVERTLRGETAV